MALKVRMKTGEKEGTKLFFSPKLVITGVSPYLHHHFCSVIYFLCCEFLPFSKNYLGESILCHKFSIFWGNFFVKTPKKFIFLNSKIHQGV
jgi:hypothetical protein